MSSRTHKILNLIKAQAIDNIDVTGASPDVLSNEVNVLSNTGPTLSETFAENHNGELSRDDLQLSGLSDLPSNSVSTGDSFLQDESSNVAICTPMVCKLKNISVLGTNDKSEISNFSDRKMIQSTSSKSPLKENQAFNIPTVYPAEISSHHSTPKASDRHNYLIENQGSTKIKIRKVNQSYKDYSDSEEEEPFSAGSSDDYQPDDEDSSSSETSGNIENTSINNDTNSD